MFESLPDRARKEGMAQGMTQGEANIILLLLGKKFGSLTERQRDILQSMTSSQLEEIGLRIFDTDNIDDLIRIEKD